MLRKPKVIKIIKPNPNCHLRMCINILSCQTWLPDCKNVRFIMWKILWFSGLGQLRNLEGVLCLPWPVANTSCAYQYSWNSDIHTYILTKWRCCDFNIFQPSFEKVKLLCCRSLKIASCTYNYCERIFAPGCSQSLLRRNVAFVTTRETNFFSVVYGRA